MTAPITMPGGDTFALWDDTTVYTRVYHVACAHPHASDANPGTAARPFLTISRAAELLQPGEKVVVHAGVYRECVRPARGGESAARMIAYEAAPGEAVHVRGSRVWQPDVQPSADAGLRVADAPLPPGVESETGTPVADVPVWMAALPAAWFVGYNPFLAANVFREKIVYGHKWTREEEQTFYQKRGMVFYRDAPLQQVYFARDLLTRDGAFWVDEDGLHLHFRLPGDAAPHGETLEVTVQEQVFAPAVLHLGYLRVSGFHFAHAADGIPVPQHGLVSASRGHHWIIEDCAIRWANAVGMDLGAQDWKHGRYTPNGHHIIRRNSVADCGISGIGGVGSVDETLVEDNLIERIGGLNVERCFECAGLKFHLARGVLFRRNIFRHLSAAAGLWLDYANRHCRITENLFYNIATAAGAVYIEVSHEENWVDHNVIWDIRDVPDPRYRATELAHRGIGCNIDTGEQALVAFNLFGCIPDYAAVDCAQAQHDRLVNGRTGLCRGHRVYNNIFYRCPERIHLAQAEDNACDGNLYDPRDTAASFRLDFPAPEKRLTLDAWQMYYAFDRDGAELPLTVAFDPATLTLTVHLDAPPPAHPVAGFAESTPGPIRPEAWTETDAEMVLRVAHD